MIFDKFKNIRTFIFDVDGVFTTGTVIATDDGGMNRDFNIKDGYAINHAVTNGYQIIIISGGNSEGVRKRLSKLGVQHVYTAVSDKKKKLLSIADEFQLDLNNAVYMGDDMPDIPVMEMCGISVSPADAAWEVQEVADIVTKQLGGKGAIREVIQKVLISQDSWANDTAYVW